MRITRAWLRWGGLALVAGILGAVARGQLPGAGLSVGGAGSGGGNPFKAPAAQVYSIYDYREINNVTDSLQEFLELNEELPGSVRPGQVTEEAARATLRGLLAGDKNREFFRRAAATPRLATVEGINAGAMMFLAHGEVAEAFGLLVLAVDKAPRDPDALLNLAAMALTLRKPNEALALIAAAEKSGPLPPGAWGLSGSHRADYLRGYALMVRGEYAAAKPLLARVVEAEPNLKEAALTLALVEAKLGENPRKSFLLGVWRHRGKLVSRDVPETPGESDPGDPAASEEEPNPLETGENVSPSMDDLFDLSQGKPGRLQSVERPRDSIELYALTKEYMPLFVQSMDAATHLHNNVVGPAVRQFTDSDAPPLYKRRMLSLYTRATLRYGAVAALDKAARDTDALRRKLDDLTEKEISAALEAHRPIRERQAEESNRPGVQMTAALVRRYAMELNGPSDAGIQRLSGVLQRYHQALEHEYALRSSYIYGMLAHIGAPPLRAALQAFAEEVRHEMQVHQISAVVNIAGIMGAALDEAEARSEKGEKGNGPECTDEQSKWSVSVDLQICSVELTCNSVSLEVEKRVIPPWITLSAELSIDTSGEVSIFAGPKVNAGYGAAKEGFYLTAGKEGIRDLGVKGELKTSSNTGLVSTNYKVGDGKISFLPGPNSGEPPGPLPAFVAAR